MATYYAVGATYDGVTLSLATTSGGAASVAVVTSADTIIFDANSLSLSFAADPACAVVNIQAAFAHTVTLSHAISAGAIVMGSTAATLTTGGYVITANGASGTVWSCMAGVVDTVNLVVSDTGASNKTLGLGGETYNLAIASGGAGAVILDGVSANFVGFAVTGSSTKTIQFQAGQTFKMSSIVNFNTHALVTLTSDTPGTAAAIEIVTKWSTDYVSVQDLNAVGDVPGALGYHGFIGTNAARWVLIDSPLSIPLLPLTTPGASHFSALAG